MTYSRFRSYVAESAVDAFLIVKPGTADRAVVPATAATDLLVGTSDETATALGGDVDVAVGDIAYVKLGGTVARGQPITANASSLGVVAAPATGTNNRIIGFAEVSGVSGDVITYRVAPGVIQG
ncbi:MAG: DUF2190 domain-containing protein [Burkholderiales bacterium]|nr:DUF2190 domain-containing protein [Burkholderiales bacterium]